MDRLKAKFAEKALATYKEMRALLKEHGEVSVGDVKLRQTFGGMRGVKSMIYETSALDAMEGIRFRGYTIPELRNKLPKYKGGKEPLPEGLFWLMLVDELPTEEDVQWLSDEWERRGTLTDDVKQIMDAVPAETHPMTQLTIGIMALQPDTVFSRRY